MNSKQNTGKIVIVLAMHGSPPLDFPKHELGEFFNLHLRIEHMPQSVDAALKQRCDALEAKMRAWPRTKENDPFFVSSNKLANQIKKITGNETFVGFNEFCNPTVEEALLEALSLSPEKVIVITPMMTPGGEHSEIDIPATIKSVQAQHPDIPIIYAWPFDRAEVAQFLSGQIEKYR